MLLALSRSRSLFSLAPRLAPLVPLCARYAHGGSLSGLPAPPALKALESPEDMAQARAWLQRFRAAASGGVPKTLVELSFSRSSGPGGQNVNKVNTKATARCAIDAPWIPLWAGAHIRSSPHYTANSNSILITSTVHRSQSQNIDDCLSKLRDLVADAAAKSVVNEASEEQKERVRRLERVDAARRKETKMRQSAKKAGRSSKGWD